MPDTTAEFFDRLQQAGREPRFGTASGTLRFQLADGTTTENWLVTVTKGDVSVSRRGKADCVVRCTKRVFEQIARGEANAFASVLRGLVTVDGDTKILIRFMRLFPGPSSEGR